MMMVQSATLKLRQSKMKKQERVAAYIILAYFS